VDALERMRAALRPDGFLLDIRPKRARPWVEVQRAGATERLGQIDDSYRISTLEIADAALQTLIGARRFGLEQEMTFDYIYHCDDVDAWLAFMAEHWNSATVSDDVIARARTALAEKEGELRIVRAIHAARYRRL
jgi:hypothetical protein